jgi:hypothetical protein
MHSQKGDRTDLTGREKGKAREERKTRSFEPLE